MERKKNVGMAHYAFYGIAVIITAFMIATVQFVTDQASLGEALAIFLLGPLTTLIIFFFAGLLDVGSTLLMLLGLLLLMAVLV